MMCFMLHASCFGRLINAMDLLAHHQCPFMHTRTHFIHAHSHTFTSFSSVGHKGKFGHEFLEFEFRPDGRCRYANNSNYKNDQMIKKESMRLLGNHS